MLVRCLIERDNRHRPEIGYIGSKVKMGDEEYHFKPAEGDSGPHVCEVTDKKHLQKFAANDSFEVLFGDDDEDDQIPQKAADAVTGDDDSGAGDEADGTSNSLQPGDDGDKEDDAEEDSDKDEVELDRDVLADEFEAKFGNKPPANWKAETIKKKLDAPAE